MAKSPIPPEVWSEAEAAYKGQGNGAWRHARAVVEAAGYKASRAQIQKHMERSEVGAAFCPRTTSQWEGGTVIGSYPTHVAGSLPWSSAPSSGAEPKPASKRPPRIAFIPDTQCQPGEDFSHLEWAGRYIAEREVDIIVHAGDHWDLPSLSTYETKGSKYFEGRRYLEDVSAGNSGLISLQKGLDSNGPWSPRKVMLRGNHEWRGNRAVESDPRLEGIIGEHLFNDLELGWEVVPFLKPIELHDILFAHYFYQPNSGRPYTGAIETRLRAIGSSFCQGHQQGIQYGCRPMLNGQLQVGLVAGSYYRHCESYRGHQATAEWRGILILNECVGGSFDLLQVSLGYLQRKFG